MLMHRSFTDDDLGAYLDGGLDAGVRKEIESELVENADLRAQLARVERLNAAVRNVIGEVEPTPDRFAQIVNEGFDRREGANVISMRHTTPNRMLQWRTPIAAGLALFVTAAGGYWAGNDSQRSETVAGLSVVASGSRLFEVIDTTPSGEAISLDGQTVTPVLSFAAADGRACREVEVSSGRDQSIAILCREDESWRVEILVASGASSSSGYETVGDEAGAAVEQVYSRLGGASAMSADEERAMMARDWRR
jgi:uncharacterized protein (UPF0335 family)